MSLSFQDILVSEIHIEQFSDYKFYNPIVYNKDFIQEAFIVANSLFTILDRQTNIRYPFKILSFYHHATKKSYSYCVELGITIHSTQYILKSIEGVVVSVFQYINQMLKMMDTDSSIEKFYLDTPGSRLYQVYCQISTSHLNDIFFPMKNLGISKKRIEKNLHIPERFVLDDYKVFSLKAKKIVS